MLCTTVLSDKEIDALKEFAKSLVIPQKKIMITIEKYNNNKQCL